MAARVFIALSAITYALMLVSAFHSLGELPLMAFGGTLVSLFMMVTG